MQQRSEKVRFDPFTHELIHWTQVERAGLVRQALTKAQFDEFEQNVLITMWQWGYR
jgi:hypothetical protein